MGAGVCGIGWPNMQLGLKWGYDADENNFVSVRQPSRHYINVLGQLLKYIPQGIVQAAAREDRVDT